jgi:hypothetical protein
MKSLGKKVVAWVVLTGLLAVPVALGQIAGGGGGGGGGGTSSTFTAAFPGSGTSRMAPT